MHLPSRAVILVSVALAAGCERAPAPLQPSAAATGPSLGVRGAQRTWPATRAAADTCATCGAPRTSLAGPRDLSAAVDGTTVTLSWTAMLTTSWIVEAGSAPGLSDLAAIDIGNPPGNPEVITFTGVPPGIYYVRVSAFLANVGLTQPSNEIVVVVGGVCATATPPSALAAAVSGATVSLVWTAPGDDCRPTSYVIEAGSSPGLSDLAAIPLSGAVPAFSAAGVGSGIYYVRVRAGYGSTISAPSNEVVVVVLPDFTGRWAGSYVISDCTNIEPAGLTPLNLCGYIARSQNFESAIAQSGAAASGTYTQRTPLISCPCAGNYGTYAVAGTVAPDGTLTLSGSGTVPASGLLGAFTFRLRRPNAVALEGAIAVDLFFGGVRRASYTGTLTSTTRQ